MVELERNKSVTKDGSTLIDKKSVETEEVKKVDPIKEEQKKKSRLRLSYLVFGIDILLLIGIVYEVVSIFATLFGSLK